MPVAHPTAAHPPNVTRSNAPLSSVGVSSHPIASLAETVFHVAVASSHADRPKSALFDFEAFQHSKYQLPLCGTSGSQNALASPPTYRNTPTEVSRPADGLRVHAEHENASSPFKSGARGERA